MTDDPGRPATPILALEDVTKTFVNLAGQPVHALRRTSIAVYPGEIMAVVGESGSGKSTLGRIALGIIQPDTGSVRVLGRDWTHMDKAERKKTRATVQPIFQDPTTSLNPRRTIRGLLRQASWPHGADHEQVALEMLGSVGLKPAREFLDRYPHELSGGQRQRLAIARALATHPSVIVADEPLSGADVSVRGQILNLLLEIRRARNVSYLMITHDISIARYFADRIAVMKSGEIVEQGNAESIMSHPGHDYTRTLVQSAGMRGAK